MVDKSTRSEAGDDSALAGVANDVPSWQRARELQEHAAGTGFAWSGPAPVIAKLAEELDEVCDAVQLDQGADRIEDEIGDMLFVLVNLCRHTDVDFDHALHHANAKFERRFRAMERFAKGAHISLIDCDLATQQAFWQKAKAEESDS